MAKRVANRSGRTSSRTTRKAGGKRGTVASGRGTSRGRSAGRKRATAATGRSASGVITGRGMRRSTGTARRRSSTAANRSGSSAQSQSRARRQNIRSVQRSTGRDAGGAAHPLFDHEDIRIWAEARGAVPTCVRGTGRRGDMGMIRLEFPRFGQEPKLQPVNWDQWFEKFDQSGLALLVQEETGSGEKSNFNKLVKRSTVEAKAKPKVRGAH